MNAAIHTQRTLIKVKYKTKQNSKTVIKNMNNKTQTLNALRNAFSLFNRLKIYLKETIH